MYIKPRETYMEHGKTFLAKAWVVQRISWETLITHSVRRNALVTPPRHWWQKPWEIGAGA